MFYHSHPVTQMFAFALAACAPIRGTLVPEARTLPAPSPRSVSLAALPTLVVEAKVDALHNSTLLDSSSTNKTRGALCPHNLDAPALDVAEADARALRHLTLDQSLSKSTSSLPKKTAAFAAEADRRAADLTAKNRSLAAQHNAWFWLLHPTSNTPTPS